MISFLIAEGDGFKLQEALDYLFSKIPGLYEYGFSKDSLHRMCVAPRKGTIRGRSFYGVVIAKVAPKRNSARPMPELTHYGRAQNKIIKEWFEFYGQPRFSGDDMNIIQVGRPAVSRYHQNRKLFLQGHGINHDVHNFPSAEMGLKLGGFMLLHRDGGMKQRSVW